MRCRGCCMARWQNRDSCVQQCRKWASWFHVSAESRKTLANQCQLAKDHMGGVDQAAQNVSAYRIIMQTNAKGLNSKTKEYTLANKNTERRLSQTCRCSRISWMNIHDYTHTYPFPLSASLSSKDECVPKSQVLLEPTGPSDSRKTNP